jgi:hypothetical protein
LTIHPRSGAEVKERVELYLFSPSGPSCTVLGRALPLPFYFCLSCVAPISEKPASSEIRIDICRWWRQRAPLKLQYTCTKLYDVKYYGATVFIFTASRKSKLRYFPFHHILYFESRTQCTVEPGYNDVCLYDTSPIALDIL